MALSIRVLPAEIGIRSPSGSVARRRANKKKVTAIHKNTEFKLGCGLFVEACAEVAKDYPDITFETRVVDTFAMNMVMHPQDFDVVVSTNMFGDILTDEAAGLVGGLGMAPGYSEKSPWPRPPWFCT